MEDDIVSFTEEELESLQDDFRARYWSDTDAATDATDSKQLQQQQQEQQQEEQQAEQQQQTDDVAASSSSSSSAVAPAEGYFFTTGAEALLRRFGFRLPERSDQESLSDIFRRISTNVERTIRDIMTEMSPDQAVKAASPKVVLLQSESIPLTGTCAPFSLDSDEPIHLSFSGCGLLGVYHIGVAHSLVHEGPAFLDRVEKFAGASAGSLVAAAFAAVERERFEEVIDTAIEWFFELCEEVRGQDFGVLSISLIQSVRTFLERILPEDAHQRASGRLYVSVTKADAKRNDLRSTFVSREQLIQFLLASACIPLVTADKPIEIKGTKYVDGGFTDNLPQLAPGRTVTVSPFAGNQDICPLEDHESGSKDTASGISSSSSSSSSNNTSPWHINFANHNIMINSANVRRSLHVFAPPEKAKLEAYLEAGKADARRFLRATGVLHDTDNVRSIGPDET